MQQRGEARTVVNKSMSSAQKNKIGRINKRIRSILLQHLKVLTTAGTEKYSTFFEFVSEALNHFEESIASDPLSEEMCLFFSTRLTRPLRDCVFLKSMGTEVVVSQISDDSASVLKSYTEGTLAMIESYVKKHHYTEDSIDSISKLCQQVNSGNNVATSDTSMAFDIVSKAINQAKGWKTPSQATDEVFKLIPPQSRSEIISMLGMTEQDIKQEINRVVTALQQKTVASKLRKNFLSIIAITSSILRRGPSQKILSCVANARSQLVTRLGSVRPNARSVCFDVKSGTGDSKTRTGNDNCAGQQTVEAKASTSNYNNDEKAPEQVTDQLDLGDDNSTTIPAAESLVTTTTALPIIAEIDNPEADVPEADATLSSSPEADVPEADATLSSAKTLPPPVKEKKRRSKRATKKSKC